MKAAALPRAWYKFPYNLALTFQSITDSKVEIHIINRGKGVYKTGLACTLATKNIQDSNLKRPVTKLRPEPLSAVQ